MSFQVQILLFLKLRILIQLNSILVTVSKFVHKTSHWTDDIFALAGEERVSRAKSCLPIGLSHWRIKCVCLVYYI